MMEGSLVCTHEEGAPFHIGGENFCIILVKKRNDLFPFHSIRKGKYFFNITEEGYITLPDPPERVLLHQMETKSTFKLTPPPGRERISKRKAVRLLKKSPSNESKVGGGFLYLVGGGENPQK